MNYPKSTGAPAGTPGTQPATPTRSSRGMRWVWGILLLLALVTAGILVFNWPEVKNFASLLVQEPEPTLVPRDPPPAQSPDVATSASAPAAAASAADQTVAALARADQALAAPAPVAKKRWKPIQGDTLTGRFGKDAKAVCELNKLKSCNRIYPGTEYELPDGVEPRKAQLKTRVTRPAAAVTPRVTAPAVLRGGRVNAAGELIYDRVGRAPLNGCGRRDILSIAEEAWLVLGLSEEDRAWLRLNIDSKNGPQINDTDSVVKLIPGMRLEQVTFCRDGKVVAVGPVRTAWSPNEAVYGQKFVLPSGKTVVWMRNCFNWVPWIPEKKRDIPGPGRTTGTPGDNPVTPPPPPQPTTPPGKLPLEEDVVLQKYDWDAGVYAGGDRDVRYAGGEAAFYPMLWHRPWGRYALGVGGFGNLWNGETSEGYAFRGHYGGIGLAQKWSTYERRDLGVKFPMVGALHEQGGSGAFREERRADLICGALSYNDASREKSGKTSLPEWQVWTSYCDPISQSKSQTWFGQPLDTANAKDITHIVSVGGRVYLSKDLTGVAGPGGVAAKLQPYAELGANKTAPFPYSAHAYLGLRTTNKVFGCGVGPHYSDATNTTVPGLTCNYDIGRHAKLTYEQERWSAMVQSLEALGVAVEDD